jgi:hypothetical protein
MVTGVTKIQNQLQAIVVGSSPVSAGRSTGMAGNLRMFLATCSARGEVHHRIFGGERFGELAEPKG